MKYVQRTAKLHLLSSCNGVQLFNMKHNLTQKSHFLTVKLFLLLNSVGHLNSSVCIFLFNFFFKKSRELNCHFAFTGTHSNLSDKNIIALPVSVKVYFALVIKHSD